MNGVPIAVLREDVVRGWRLWREQNLPDGVAVDRLDRLDLPGQLQVTYAGGFGAGVASVLVSLGLPRPLVGAIVLEITAALITKDARE